MLCLHFLVLWDCRVQLLFGNTVALSPRQGGVRDVASVIISHEQTQSNRVCCFQSLDARIAKGSPFQISFMSGASRLAIDLIFGASRMTPDLKVG